MNHFFERIGTKDHVHFKSLCGLTPRKPMFPENPDLLHCKNCLNEFK